VPKDTSLIGAPLPRTDARSKATGREIFAADHYPANLLWAGVKRAGVAHGRLRAIHSADAETIEGVAAVLTHQHISPLGANRQGITHKDMPVLAVDTVRHAGEAVALVLAETKHALRRGLDAISLDIEPLPAVFDPLTALEPDAPAVHEGRPEGNVLAKAELRCGQPEAAFDDPALRTVEGWFKVPMQAHAFLETENGVAWLDDNGTLVVTASTQAPFRDRLEISHALGIPVEKLRVIAPYLGGGFGGKDGVTVQCLLALAALHSNGRPVKMHWEREESMVAGYKRHAARMHYKLAARPDGQLHALHCRLYYDTGAYAHLGSVVIAMALEHAAGPYRVPHAMLQGWSVYTNNPVAGAMRAFGAVQPAFALECLLDALAAKLGLDPLEIRQRNVLRQGDTNCAGVLLANPTGLTACLDTLARYPAWRKREAWIAAAPPFTRRGVGLATAVHAMGYGKNVPDFAAAKIELTQAGGLRIYVGVSDMGQGNASAYAQIAAEILRQPADSIELVLPDTARTLYSGSSAASRTTYTFGNALLKACRELRTRILHRAALLCMRTHMDGLELEPGCVCGVPLARIAAMMQPEERVCIGEHLVLEPAAAPATGKDIPYGFPHSRFCYAAHLAGVEVDTLTGRVRVATYAAVTDAGHVLNPQNFEQQVQGAIAQGLGYALSEEFAVTKGIVRTPDFTRYIIPTALDLPDIESVAVESFEPSGPFGLKGVGEIGAIGPLPAVANAVARAVTAAGGDATLLRRAPLTPERVLAALERSSDAS